MSKQQEYHDLTGGEYCGRILTDSVGRALKERVAEGIRRLRILDELDVPVMPYVAAWRTDSAGSIWYEFVGRRLARLLDCQPCQVADLFRQCLTDHRHYKYEAEGGGVKERILEPGDLAGRRQRLRDQRRRIGGVDAVYRLLLPGGREVWLKDRGNVECFEEDQICISLGCLMEVTLEMIQKDLLSEQNVVVSRDKGVLVEAERQQALGQLSAQVFHSIRNPLSAIGGLARRLQAKAEDEDLGLYAEVIGKEAGRLERILNHLFRFTQPIELHPRPVEPGSLVKSALFLLKTELDENRIRIKLDLAAGLPLISVDPERIEEALVHIIKNAVEAHPEEGRVEIRACRDGGALFFVVKDYGLGIRPVHENRVTEPFFTTKVYGTGFGLSLARRYVELHGGELKIAALQPSGTRVVMRLPLEPEAAGGPPTGCGECCGED